MANIKEIKRHTKSVKDTGKITNAMYLIASTKLRKAKLRLAQTQPYFESLKHETTRLFQVIPRVDSPYFCTEEESRLLTRKPCACLVVTADKGMAGAYNMNVLRAAEQFLQTYPKAQMLVCGEYGRQYFLKRGLPFDRDFHFSIENPTMDLTRQIGSWIRTMTDQHEIASAHIIYTARKNSLVEEVVTTQILPFHHSDFPQDDVSRTLQFEFFPSPEAVVERIVPSYLSGFLYSALVESYCCEQNARMNAMSAANDNAEKILDQLTLEMNRVRQTSITQEITEISSGAKAQARKKEAL